MYDYYAYEGPGPAYYIFSLLLSLFMLICLWKIFVKAGKPGWAAIVPIYNCYVLFEITWGKGIKFLLMLIPLANIVFGIMTCVKLVKAFGKDGVWAVGLIFLGIVFYPILAFGSSRYLGVPGANPTPGYNSGYPGYQPQGDYAPPSGYDQPQPGRAPQPETAARVCPSCGGEISGDASFCPLCGARL